MKTVRSGGSPWAVLAVLLAAFTALAVTIRGDGLDAATRIAPRNPMIEVHLRDLDRGEKLALDVLGVWEMRTPNGTRLANGDGLRGWLRFGPEGVTVGGWQMPSDHVVLHAYGDAAIRLDTLTYRGRLHLRRNRAKDAPPLELTLELPLEDYVLGVLVGEMSSARPGVAEALRAQAVAARTYAVWQLRRGRERLRSTAVDQRFLSVDFETQAARDAVRETTGQILKHANRIVPAYFHADCGGATSPGAQHGFGDHPALHGTRETGPSFHGDDSTFWTRLIEADKLDTLAKRWGVGDWIAGLDVVSADRGGRVQRVRVFGDDSSHELYGEQLRSALRLPSIMVDRFAVLGDGSLRVDGRGRGHGIGLCQIGAVAQARAGREYREILAHYYPGAEVDLLTSPVRN